MISPPSGAPASLNILMVACVPSRREGGVAGMIYNLGREMERRGHTVTYLFKDDLLDPARVSARFLDLVFALRLARYLRANRGKFSVVNLHAPAGFVYGLLKRWFPSPQDAPYVMTLHGLEERRVHVMGREARKGRAWNFNWKNRLWHNIYIYPRFRWSIRTADAAHTIARDTWNLLQLKYNLDADRVAYIPNGIASRFFAPRKYDHSGPLKLLYAGTWLDQRGIFYLREALSRLAPQLPGLTMTFAGCGCPPEMIADFFGPHLASTIVIKPVVPAGEMHQLYREHDVFLFPSLMEGQPTVVLEAMASGMPVITTETCGMTDVIFDGVNGLLIPPANAPAIEQAVLQLARSAGLRQTLGEAAQQSMKPYTWERAGEKLEALFHCVLQQKSIER